MNFNDLAQSFKRYALHEKELTPKTTKAIIKAAEKLDEFTADKSLTKLDTPVIREYLLNRREDRLWSPKTFRNERQYLKTFFDWLLREGIVKSNPVEKIEKPKLPKRLPRFITKDQSLTILAHTEYYNWRYRFERVRNVAIIAVFLMTGIRLNELINLRVQDVDLDTQEIFVHEGKGKKDRIVPIYPKLQSILSNYNRERKHLTRQSQWFFHSARSDKRMTPKTVHQMCKKVSYESGIKFTPHMLRHTFGRLSLDGGLGMYQLKELMGHSNISTTEIYASVSKEGLKRSFYNTQLF